MEGTQVQPNSLPGAAAPPPPPGWPMVPPTQKPGLSTAAIVVIVVVVVVVVLLSVVAVAVLFLLATPLQGPGNVRPIITFSQPTAVTNGFQFEVAGASRALAAANYRAALSANATAAGTAQALTATMAFGQYTVAWTDLGGEGDLTGGDTFRVTRPFGLPANTDLVFTILWSDGSTCGSRDYST